MVDPTRSLHPIERTNADTSFPFPNSCLLHICLADIPHYPQQSAEKRESTIGDHSKNNPKRKRRTNMSSADHSRFPLREPAAIPFAFEHHVVSIIYLSMQLCILTSFAFRLGPTSRKSVFGPNIGVLTCLGSCLLTVTAILQLPLPLCMY
jgi:hypothetical protein